MKYIYIHNKSTRDGVCVHEYDSTDIIYNNMKWYIERYTEVVFILDFNDKISYGTIDKLITVLKKITESNNVVIDMTLRCNSIISGHIFYGDFISLLKRD